MIKFLEIAPLLLLLLLLLKKNSKQIFTRNKRMGYNLTVMKQTACLSFNKIVVDRFVFLFTVTTDGRVSDSKRAQTQNFRTFIRENT